MIYDHYLFLFTYYLLFGFDIYLAMDGAPVPASQESSDQSKLLSQSTDKRQWSAELNDFLESLDTYTPTIPESVVKYNLQKGGCRVIDPRILKMVGLATDKFVAEIIHESKEISKNRHSSKKRKVESTTLEMVNILLQ